MPRPFKIKLFTFIVALTLETGVDATQITCGIPTNDAATSSNRNTFIKLLEPKTILTFDTFKRVSKFWTPNCIKFQNIAFWNTSIKIECESNNGRSINLNINTTDLTFKKIYQDNQKQSKTLVGFCAEMN